MAQERMMAMLAAAFGAVALLLVCIGLYGLEAYRVAQHTREIGIRLALGATGRQVIAAVLTNAAMLVIVGVVVGLPAAWVASRSIRSMLFGLEPGDPRTLMAAILLLMAAALVAAYLPAQRAARVDPLVALRHD